MELSRPEYWNGLLYLSPGDLPEQGLNRGLPHCGQIFYLLSYLGSLYMVVLNMNAVVSMFLVCSFNLMLIKVLFPAL